MVCVQGRSYRHSEGFFSGLGSSWAGEGDGVVLPAMCQLMGKISRLFQMLLNFANDTEEGLDFFMYLSDVSAPKTLFAPLNSGFADNEVSKQGLTMEAPEESRCHQSWHDSMK